MKARLLFFFWFFCIVVTTVNSQDIIRSFNTENGLPANGILGLQFDEETGFLWVATEAGLVRFNGLHFKNYPRDFNVNFTRDRRIFLVRNNKNEIYTADRLGNTFRIRNNQSNFRMKFPMSKERKGNLFLISTTEQLIRKYINTAENYNYNIPFDKLVNWNDTACFILKEKKLIRFGLSGQKKIIPTGIYGKINCIFKVGNEIFIKDQEERIYLFNPLTETLKQIFVRSEVKKLIELEKEEHLIIWENGMEHPILFIGTRAWILKKGRKFLDALPISDNIPPNSFISFAQYSEKRELLFIGTDSKGIMVIQKPVLKSSSESFESFLSRNTTYGQLEQPDGSILSNQGVIYGSKDSSAKDLWNPGSYYYSIFNTHDSLIWFVNITDITGSRRLHCYNKRTQKTKIFDKIFSDEQIAVAPMDTSVIIASDKGIGRLVADSINYLLRFQKPGNLIYQLEEFNPGSYILATCDGLLSFNLSNKRLDTLMKGDNYCVRNFRKVGDYLLIGTYGNGMFIWKNNKVVRLPLDKNNYLKFAHCFTPDKNGFCWISSNRGLFKASLKELLAAFKNPAASVYYHYYGTLDGMKSTELNGGCQPCALELKNGQISYPSMDGLVYADPSKQDLRVPNPEIHIDDWIIDGISINPDSAMTKPFPAGSSEVTIRLGIPAWNNRENIYLEYQLNNEPKWELIPVENDESIRLKNLRYGDYKIRIRMRKGFGPNDYIYKDLGFSIAAPWNRQPWFYYLIGTCILGFILLINKLRNRRQEMLKQKLQNQVEEKTKELSQKNLALEKGNAIKNRLISIISHDIITPLKFMTAAGKNLLDTKKQMPEELKVETIKEITQTSQELQFLSTNILNWIKFQNEKKILKKDTFNASELVEQVFNILQSTARQKNITLLNEVDRQIQLRQFYEPTKIVLYNLCLNAINFSEKGVIVVRNRQLGEVHQLIVIDRGIGMKPEQISNILDNDFIVSSPDLENRKGNGLGYLIIKDLLQMMSAEIRIESEPMKGTSVCIIFPPDRKKKSNP